jgi:hypothetical protein
MTDEQRSEEGAEEAIEDLEAPAAAQSDVAGGRIVGGCPEVGTCFSPSKICQKPSTGDLCQVPSCKATEIVAKAV